MPRLTRPAGRLWAPTLVLALAALLRLVHLATVPFGWHPDEATKALLALDVLAGKYFPAFFSAFTGREALYVYLEAGLLALLGDPLFAGRLLSAFCGVAHRGADLRAGRYPF
jgi:predicted membrane-bound mannosyltransferase